ncbi:hypothetical protein [Candidatus Endoriftia persephonae]|jgi:hypothetical protein|uniref:Uncharacterized protein n=4 Tax=Gammaproteobacteria TaxID=1236 RepID=G2FDT3_9GAMM|nr:hypothetical protein [Candidatus Endoriftia persephone]EGW55138.1 hypothetical protein TevJSym_af01030 [endosymbiont of Tevnia jerichonana (vent Tica)]USF88256.1 hypothetical protein L0Y14_03185 [Candidatus Endoriftia persephone]
MPGRTWRDLQHNPAPGPSDQSIPVGDRASGTARAVQQSPRLAALLQQRKALESRLHTLTSGEGEPLDPRDAARFQVPSFAERRTQQRAWEAHREALQRRSAELRRAARSGSSRPGSAAPSTSTTRSDATSHGSSVNQWLARRDTQRQTLREAARDRLSPLNNLANVGRQLGGSLSRTSAQLRNLDRQLAEHGLDQEREELRKLGADKLSKATAQLDKYTKMAEAPQRAVEKIDQFWQDRQRQISGAMDQTGPYAERTRRRLSTDNGGSGDLFERMQRNRMRALQRRQEQRREEERDQARRDRARHNRQGALSR